MIAAIGIVLLFLLTQATSNRELYERNYGRLFVINVVVAGVLLLVIVWVAVRLISRLRQGKFGSRLLVKLAAIFALVGFVPGVLIYVVSYQFVSRSIESWFDVKVEGALDAGLNLGRATLDTLATTWPTRRARPQHSWPRRPTPRAPLALERLREQLSANDVVLWSGTGQLIASAGAVALPAEPGAARRRSSCARCAPSASLAHHRGAGRARAWTPRQQRAASRRWRVVSQPEPRNAGRAALSCR